MPFTNDAAPFGGLGAEKFRAVRIFVRAVEARSFVRAAAALGLMPSAVSKAVSALEQEFGVRLLHWTTRRIAATEDGAAYYERCRRLLADHEEAESALRQGSAGPRGTLKVDMPVTVARIFVEPALPGFLAAHPGLRVEARLSDCRVDLLEENVDAAIRLGVLEGSRLVARKLRQDDWVTVASPAYLRRRGVPEVPASCGRRATSSNATSPRRASGASWPTGRRQARPCGTSTHRRSTSRPRCGCSGILGCAVQESDGRPNIHRRMSPSTAGWVIRGALRHLAGSRQARQQRLGTIGTGQPFWTADGLAGS
jgi:DNA-binding transcriptional LysR family regulator